jgi:hypothetical protein
MPLYFFEIRERRREQDAGENAVHLIRHLGVSVDQNGANLPPSNLGRWRRWLTCPTLQQVKAFLPNAEEELEKQGWHVGGEAITGYSAITWKELDGTRTPIKPDWGDKEDSAVLLPDIKPEELSMLTEIAYRQLKEGNLTDEQVHEIMSKHEKNKQASNPIQDALDQLFPKQ